MSEMIDRVAKALCAAVIAPGTMTNVQWSATLARAAIEAMTEPTDEMLARGSEAAEVCDDGWESNATWRAMIYAALTNGE